MAEYRRGAHTVFEIHLHLVWITKYLRPALQGEIAMRVRDLIRTLRPTRGIDHEGACIERQRASRDLASAAGDDQPPDAMAEGSDRPPPAAEFPHLKKQFLGATSVGSCCSSGNLTDDVIAKYVADQKVDQDEDFQVDG
jgi:putative transposase